MNFMKAFLAMNPISKFLSLVNSHFFPKALQTRLCLYSCQKTNSGAILLTLSALRWKVKECMVA